MNAAEGILTSRGGMTSHAALVARGMGKPCVVGCAALTSIMRRHTMEVNGRTVREGDFLSIDGTTGEVIEGESHQFLGDRPGPLGKEDPAEGLPDLPAVRQNDVLGGRGRRHRRSDQRRHAPRRHGAVSSAPPASVSAAPSTCSSRPSASARPRNDPGGYPRERRAALAKILPMQRGDFVGIFRAMDGYPVIIRTLDPPLHEFLPHGRASARSPPRWASPSKS